MGVYDGRDPFEHVNINDFKDSLNTPVDPYVPPPAKTQVVQAVQQHSAHEVVAHKVINSLAYHLPLVVILFIPLYFLTRKKLQQKTLWISFFMLWIILVIFNNGNAASLSRADKQGFIESFSPSCIGTMEKTSTMTDEQIHKWCGCVGVEYVNILTKEELLIGKAVSQKINAANKACEERLLTPAGLFK